MTLKRFATMTAIAVALAIPAASGFAQSPAAPSPSTSPASPPTATPAPRAAAPAATAPSSVQAPRHMGSTEMRASKVIGSSVYDTGNQKIGSIADLIVDRDGKVSDVVIGVGGFLGTGDKNVAVKMAELKRGKDNHLVLGATKDALKQMPAYELNRDAAARSGSSTRK